MNQPELQQHEKVSNLLSSLDFYRDMMTPDQAVYVASARRKFIQNEIQYLLECGQDLTSILTFCRSKKLNDQLI